MGINEVILELSVVLN